MVPNDWDSGMEGLDARACAGEWGYTTEGSIYSCGTWYYTDFMNVNPLNQKEQKFTNKIPLLVPTHDFHFRLKRLNFFLELLNLRRFGGGCLLLELYYVANGGMCYWRYYKLYSIIPLYPSSKVSFKSLSRQQSSLTMVTYHLLECIETPQ